MKDRNGVHLNEVPDVLFGVSVSDPYRSLEDGSDAGTIAWTARQNAATRSIIDGLPSRASFQHDFDGLLAIGSLSVPIERNGRQFFTERGGTQKHPVLYMREGDVDRLLIDPAALDESGLTTLDWWYPSPKGNFMAFGLSHNGDERSTLFVLNVATGERLADIIPRTMRASLAWFLDETGFYYTRLSLENDYNKRLYRHTLGAAWSEDILVFGEGRAQEDWATVQLSGNGRWLLVTETRSAMANDFYLADLHCAERSFVTLVEGADAIYDVHSWGDDLVIRSNEGAPRYALYIVDAKFPQRDRWRELVPQTEDILDAVAVTRDRIVITYIQNAQSRLAIVDRQGAVYDVALPPMGAIADMSSRELSQEAYVLYESFTQAPTIYCLDATKASLDVWKAVTSPVDALSYHVEQVWFQSSDGVRIPMYVLAHATTMKDASAPAVLTGYGGFNLSRLPSYASTLLSLPWLEAGGIYAVANLRGGGEFGETWHRAGMLHHKQRVFDDFIAAAEFLGSNAYADPSRIGIMGGSNGGLLVAAATVQRPELFRAVVCRMPLCDMVRYPRFLIARRWISEYGDPENADDFRVLYAYSPYHNVHDGVAYPGILFNAAESDSRVDPLHARKMAARMQAATSSDQPVLLYVEAQAGHGAGKPRDKQVEELADMWSFFAWQLNVPRKQRRESALTAKDTSRPNMRGI